MQLNGAQILMEELVKHGVTTVFGYPGGAVLNIYDELYQNAHRIQHVLTAHEQGAAHAADGYARTSGKTGVVIATSGPGSTNLVTGIANAYLDSVPMVAITGNVASPLMGRDSFQEVDIVGITQPIVKHNFFVRDVTKLERTLKQAFAIASSGRKGPVLVDIPKDVQASKCEYPVDSAPLNIKEGTFERDLSQALEAISKSERPYIYCGGGVLAADAGAEVLALSKKLSAPIGLSMMGLTAIPASYELNLGMCGMHGTYASSVAQSESDLMIAVGVRFSDRATGNLQEYTKRCKVIHIDIDAAELGKNVNSNISLCGNVKDVVSELLQKVEEQKHPEWIAKIKEYQQAGKPQSNGDFTPKNIIEMVNEHVSKDTVIATDVGQHQMWTMLYYQFEQPRTLLTSGGLGTMGYGMGAAIGGCIARSKQRTVLFTSDGSFGMNLNELATAVSQKLPVVVVLLNNGALGMVRQWQNMFYNQHYSSTTLERKTDFPLLAKAFGADGWAVTSLSELEDILKHRLPQEGPCVLDCRIDMDERVFPMIPPGGSVKNIVTS